MKKLVQTILGGLGLLLAACSNESNFPAADNDMDAGRNFIDANMKGEFKKANFYMIQNQDNTNLLQNAKKTYDEKDKSFRNQYREANIIITNDSVLSKEEHIIFYSNSLDKKNRKIAVIEQDGKWSVDLKKSDPTIE